MKIAVFGAGAVGSYYGGRLAEAGHDVTLIGRAAHVAAIRSGGLKIESSVFTTSTSHPHAAESLPAGSDPDLVLLTVKAFDTARAGASLKGRIGLGTRVLSLQNGVDNHLAASGGFGNVGVHPTVVYVAVGLVEPGLIRHLGRGEIVLPEELSDLVPVFAEARIPAKTSGNIEGVLWNKLLLNASLNAMSMITGASFGELAASSDAESVVRAAVAEVLAVARSRKVRIDVDEPARSVLETARSLGDGKSSMWQDYQAGKKIEIEALNGVVVRLGSEAGIDTPVNETLFAMARLMDQRARGGGS